MTIYNKEEKRFGLLFLYVSFTCRTFVVNASQISIIIYKKLSELRSQQKSAIAAVGKIARAEKCCVIIDWIIRCIDIDNTVILHYLALSNFSDYF